MHAKPLTFGITLVATAALVWGVIKDPHPVVQAPGLVAPVAAAAPPINEQARATTPQPARGATTPPGGRATSPANQADLPELLYLCPTPAHFDVIEDKPGKCPKDGLTLYPVRIALAYSCLNNTAFIQEKPGKCPTDKSDMVQISTSLFFGCPGTDVKELYPGKCPDGTERVKRYEPRPHGDHNPRHGGQLFMADDAWHHLEGTYPGNGLFRVYFYDDWTKPLVPKGFTARVVVKDAAGKDIVSVPLKQARQNTMEAQIPAANAGVPFRSQLHVTFKAGEREKLFDFQFPAYTKEPVAPAAAPAPATTTSATPAGRGATTPPAARGTAPPATGRGTTPPAARGNTTPPASAANPATAAAQPQQSQEAQPATNIPAAGGGLTLELMSPIIPQEDPIPPTAKAIIEELAAKAEQLATELDQGAALGQLWVPALRTKNLALALVNDHLNEIPNSQRTAALNAANQIVRSAWAIDNFGDLADKDKIMAAHEVFASAVKNLRAAYESIR